MNASIGQAVSRRDGPQKVTGTANYTADLFLPNLLYATLSCATIPAGEILELDTSAAEAVPGIIRVLTHLNTPKLGIIDAPSGVGEKHLPLQDARIHYEGQPMAIVVGETLEQVMHAAKLVRARYRKDSFETDFRQRLDQQYPAAGYFPNDTMVGDVDVALASAPVRIEATYRTADRHHNPIEPGASISAWCGRELLQLSTTQGVQRTRAMLARAFGLNLDQVVVRCEFVGGGFGCKGNLWPHQVLSALAARQVGCPVKLVLARALDYTSHGYQPATEQIISVGARGDGTLLALRHTSINPTAMQEDYIESCVSPTRALYAVPNMETHARAVRVHRGSPTPMRAPHEGPGLVALEIAMDELAYKLDLDPLALRLKNYAERDPTDGRPFAAKRLRECYKEGARRFGWAGRTMQPRSMRDGKELVGWGMATAIMDTFRFPAKARISLDRDGNVLVEGSTQEMGGGTVTVVPQIAADVLGLPIERVQLKWGDSALPDASISGGSSTTSCFGSAVYDAAMKLRRKLTALGGGEDPAPERYAELVQRGNANKVLADGEWSPGEGASPLGQPDDVALYSFGVLFVEVRIDEDFMIPRVTRGVGVFNAGRIVNPKTARSQMIGGFVWGVGQALLEASELDHRLGRYLSKNLAGYLVPVNADIPDLDMSFIEEPDFRASAIGTRGIGELGACGVSPAIANAVFHATGVRVREVPIRPEHLLG